VFIVANNRLSVDVVSRGDNKSAARETAYILGKKIRDNHNYKKQAQKKLQKNHDYTHRTDIAYERIFLCENAPLEYQDDPQKLVDDIDKSETQWNSQTFRNLVGALPNEVPHAEHVRIVEEFVAPFIAQGMIAIVAIHEGINIEEPWKSNPHMHLLLTMRPITAGGKFAECKNRDWNARGNTMLWKEQWTRLHNEAYERCGMEIRVDHRSFGLQEKEQEPLKYLCRADYEREKRGERTKRGDENRAIKARNVEREKEYERQENERQLREEIQSEIDRNFEYELER
jgi:hypothetical protein